MLLVQDGHQAHTGAREALDAEFVDGIIWSPADHRPDHLLSCASDEVLEDVAQGLDPQLYVRAPKRSQPEETPGLRGSFSVPMRPRDLAARILPRLVAGIMDYQAAIPELTHLIAPTLAVPSMADQRRRALRIWPMPPWHGRRSQRMIVRCFSHLPWSSLLSSWRQCRWSA